MACRYSEFIFSNEVLDDFWAPDFSGLVLVDLAMEILPFLTKNEF
jgi:hypothetical protein